jgi:Skp family chaperone for outer membrane proteins
MGNDNDHDDKSATEELKVGFSHLVNAAKKAVKSAEPLANRAAEEVGSTIEKLNKGTEQVAADVGREVATLAGKLADKLRAVADRADPRDGSNDPGAGGGI